MNFYIDASNIHTGGGKTMLNDFLNGAILFSDINFTIWTDKRFDIDEYKDQKNIKFFKVSRASRLNLQFTIKNLSNADDRVICFGNLPPLVKYRAKTFLFQSNRYMVEKYSTKGLPLFTRVRIYLERSIFNLFINNVDEIIVQSKSMKDLLENKNADMKVSVIPYKNFSEELPESHNSKGKSFMYIASDEPHKNHKNLTSAWVLLANEGIRPKLYLTLNKKSKIYKFIKKQKNRHSLDIENLSNISRKNLLKKFSTCSALVYPSFFESYGLPIVEANMMGIDVIASELDYVRDMCDPIETFDPSSAISISRAIKRYIGHRDLKTDIIAPQEMITYILD